MSSYNARVPADQQFQLIMECRNSGLSDYQWCKEHGIHPGTFYNWVSRLRRKACCEIPESISKAEPSPTPAQEAGYLHGKSTIFKAGTGSENRVKRKNLHDCRIQMIVIVYAWFRQIRADARCVRKQLT